MSVGHYENFPVGSLLLPARIRPAVHAIYHFARSADDLADEGDAAPEARLAALDDYRQRLLAIADKFVELKAVCGCGRKATMNLRVDEAGRALTAGAQTEIGGNDRYVAVCRRHFMDAFEA